MKVRRAKNKDKSRNQKTSKQTTNRINLKAGY